MHNNPKFSVITVCFNSEGTIEKTINSVLNQTYNNVEYIVVDGKSTDGTADIINKYKNNIQHFISEKDSGIYEAMNKGLNLATGELIYFLNSDDCFYDKKTVQNICDIFIRRPDLDLLSAKIQIVNVPSHLAKGGFNPITKTFRTKTDLVKRGVAQQSTVARKRVYDKIGNFEATYKIGGDLDWLMRALKSGINYDQYEEIIAVYNCQGTSFVDEKRRNREKHRTVLRNGTIPEIILYFLIYYYRCFKSMFITKT